MLPIRLLLLLSLVAPLTAQSRQSVGPYPAVPPSLPPFPGPSGIYCSCPPTSGPSISVLPGVAALPFVEGILVRVPWSAVEPARGVYDLTPITDQLELADAAGKRVALAVVLGSGTPTWLPGEGVPMVTYDFMGQPRSIAAAWDPLFLEIWSDTIEVLGAALGDDPRISNVHVTSSTHNGFEMQLPLNQQVLFEAAGYTQVGFIASWVSLLDTFATAFPRHVLDVEVHPVFGSDTVAEEVIDHGLHTLGSRFGAFAAWWSVDNAMDAYPGMFALVGLSAASSFAGAQVVGSWVTTPERFDDDLMEYMEAFHLAINTGVTVVEVWNADLLEPSLQPFLEMMNDRLAQ